MKNIKQTNIINGIYEEIINNKLSKELEDENLLVGKEIIDPEEAKDILAKYISDVTKKSLSYIRDENESDESSLKKQIETCNSIINVLKDNLSENEAEELKINEKAEVLTYVYSKIDNPNFHENFERPETSIARTSLFTGANSEINLDEEIKREIDSSDEIYLLVSFIKWSGLRTIIEELKNYTDNGKKLKVITTSYMGASDAKAIVELSKLNNTEVKISYDIERTRLHAKAYIFKRLNGFTTAYVGSSNMSHVAMTSGLEWNVKLSEKESVAVIKKMQSTFESYWNNPIFETFDNKDEDSKNKLNEALKKKKSENDIILQFSIKPYSYQQEILDNLNAEREVFNRFRNLLVAPTGIGKTVISAFDYRNFYEKNNRTRILYVAHREEILKKSRDTFRSILQDANFGELLVGNNKPENIEYLFTSIQSWNSNKIIEKTSPDFYDYIVVDEVHHGSAESYKKLLEYYKPKILLGLTATPERMDGKDIGEYFDKTMAYEMRLPEAIDNKLLSPFQYFGVTDSVDLSTLKWTKGGYDEVELENIYVLDEKIAERRANEIIQNTLKYVTDIEEVKGLGFCVSKKHAEFMAERFNKSGIDSIALTSDTSNEIRKDAIKNLNNGKYKFIFTVDIFNEGVDIPKINTELFLRPTQSLTIFLQQLGRGLRLNDEKECLTVLDFIGQANKNYKFLDKFEALTGKTKKSIDYYIKNGFDILPRGCYIKLEKQAKEYVLRNIKELKTNNNTLINRLSNFENDTGLSLNLKNFLNYYDINIKDFYKSGRTFTGLCNLAKVNPEITKCKYDYSENLSEKEIKTIEKRIPYLLDMDSPKLINLYKELINNPDKELNSEETILENMIYYTFYLKKSSDLGYKSNKEALKALFKDKNYREEILEILDILYEKIDFVPIENSYDFKCPLEVNCTYTKGQILASLEYYGENKYGPMLEGVHYLKDKNLDIFFITLNKSDKDFSDTTLYDDYAISRYLFHWQSQNMDKQESNKIQRYIHSNGRISLFVRDYKKTNNRSCSYIYLGECIYVSHEGNNPVSFVLKLKNPIPGKFISEANKNVL